MIVGDENKIISSVGESRFTRKNELEPVQVV